MAAARRVRSARNTMSFLFKLGRRAMPRPLEQRPTGNPSATRVDLDDRLSRSLARVRLDVLKLVAMISMVVDHVNTIWFATQYPAPRAIGRVAFPLFAFVLAYNFVRHTRHPLRFIGRLFLWGAVSQLFFVYAFENNLLNIFFTLALGLCYTALFQRAPWSALGTALAIALVAVSKFFTPIAARLDFGIEGVLLVFVFAQLVAQPTGWRAALALLFTATVNPWTTGALDVLYGAAAAASLAFIALSATWPGEWLWMRRCRLCFYFFYPAHLFLIKALAPG